MKKKLLHLLAATVSTVMLPMALQAQELVMQEDFTGFAAGTPDLADDVQIGNDADDMYTTGLLDAYTVLPGWQGYGIYQAGGTCVVKGVDYYGQPLVSLSTPAITMPGNVRITVRARIYPLADISSADMRLLMRQGWTGSEDRFFSISSEWEDFVWEGAFSGDWQLTVSVGDEAASIESVPPMQIDCIKIEDMGGDLQLSAPEASEATSVTATGFTANWNSVPGAESYLLYVEATKNGDTTLVVDGLEVPPASWGMPYKAVRDLDPDAFHSYYVKSKSGDIVSEPSNKVDVVFMTVVEPSGASDVSDDGFIANWEGCAKADSYKVNVYRLSPTERTFMKTVVATGNSCALTGLREDGAAWYAYDVSAVAEFNGKEYESVASRRQVVSMSDAPRKTERLIEEDFSRLVNGSEDEIYYKEYDPQDPNNIGPYVNLWSSQGNVIPDSYMQTPGWTGDGVGEAGGVAACSYMPYPSTYFGGNITTPMLPLGGLVTIRFRARAITQYKPASSEQPQYIPLYLTMDSDAGYDLVGYSDGVQMTVSAYKDNSGDMQREENLRICLTDNEWHEYSLTLLNYYQGEAKIAIGNAADSYAAFFIDDISIDLGLTQLPAPQAGDATDFVVDGFTANWQSVEKADDYLLSVYRRVAGKNDYAYVDIPVEGLSYSVSGLDSESDYIYTVKARSGAVVSGESRPVSALGISTPVVLDATDLETAGFTANWERTPKATRYTLNVYSGISADGIPVISEDINDGAATSCAVAGLDTETEKRYCYQLIAYYDTSSDTYESLPSATVAVDLAGMGVDVVCGGEADVVRAGDAIRITLPYQDLVVVARADGTVVKSAVLPEGETLLDVAPGSIYIVKAAGKTFKLTF